MNDYNFNASGSGGIKGIGFLVFGLAFLVFALAYRYGGSGDLKQYTVPLTATVTQCDNRTEVHESDDRTYTDTFCNLIVEGTSDSGRPFRFIIGYEHGTYTVGQQVKILSNESCTDAVIDKGRSTGGTLPFLILLGISVIGFVSGILEMLGKGRRF